ncbi:hypothetical protein AB6Q56_15270 [Dechloromonas sp. ARDL1]|uniref:hypothetical protein n=1 Tax=Dechloromonas sp. ARDL1 TaxID=3322121 RepID=UPI003DA7A340
MKQDYQFQNLLTMLTLSITATIGLSVVLFTNSKRMDRFESSLTRQAERQESSDGVIKSMRPTLDGLEIKASRAAGMAESASRTSDMALNAVGSFGRELEKRKP